ncbi:MAG: SRPBCC family protein [Pseudorhodoplanes sp.]
MREVETYSKITEPGAVRFERLLPGPIERVWAYLTEPEKRKKWFAGGEMDLRVGGKAELIFEHANLSSEKTYPEKYKQMEGGLRTQAEITRCEPPHTLAFLWFGGPGDTSEVIFELSSRGENVLFVITHRRLSDAAAARDVSIGWHSHVGILEDNLRGVEPRPFWTTHAKLEEEYRQRMPLD